MEKFISYIQSVISNAQVENSYLEKFCVPKSLNKSDILLNIGQICNYYYFVNQGVLRFFILRKMERNAPVGWLLRIIFLLKQKVISKQCLRNMAL